MNTTDKYVEEIRSLTANEEPSKEEKLEYLEKQIDGFKTQYYRMKVDTEIAQAYIAKGKEVGGEEGYTATGEKNIQEAVAALRAIVININTLCQLRDDLNSQS